MARCLTIAVSLLLTTATLADDAAKDKEKLQGLWEAVALEYQGQAAPEEQVKMFQVRFKGDKVIFDAGAREHTFAIDPQAKPKTMDLTAGDGPLKGKTLPYAIYKLDGDILTI